MKKHLLLAAAALCAAAPFASAAPDQDYRVASAKEMTPDVPSDSQPPADAKGARRTEKRMRVISAEAGGPHVIRIGADEKDLPKEIVTFLGVETAPVDPALVAQLGLKRGMGLTVRRVVPESPATAVLKEHDVLTKLNDQWLVDQHQLAVLVQSYNEGDEVALTFVRGGKEQTAKVKLIKRERPKFGSFNIAVPGEEAMRWTAKIPGLSGEGQGMHEHLQMLRKLHGPDGPHDVIINRGGGGPAPRISILRMPKAVMLFKDDAGAVELKNEDGKQLLEIRDPKEKVTFAGDVSTPEQRAKLPAEVRARLELVEAKDVLEFEPEGDVHIESRLAPEAGLQGERISSNRTPQPLGNPVMRL